MTRLDAIFATAYFAIAGIAVNLSLQGPELGLWGYGLPLLIAILGYVIGTAIISGLTGTPISYDRRFRTNMWLWTSCTAVILFVLCVSYRLFFLNGRETFDGLLFLHFSVVFFACILARIMTFTAGRAMASSDNAAKRATKVAEAKRKKSKGS
jgi:magnesium-transporting ATPase (P-type)